MTINKILLKYEPKKTNLLAVAKEIQKFFGFISEEAVEQMADYFEMKKSAVYSGISFYDQLKTKKQANLVIKVCDGSNCFCKDSARVLYEIESFFRQKVGDENNPKLKIERESCLGFCGSGPIVMINGTVFDRVTPERVDDILSGYV